MFIKRNIFKLFLLVVFFVLLVIKLTANNFPSIRGAIIPHHDVAANFVAELGQRLSHQKKISRLILIGPNHDEVGNQHISSDPILLAEDHACFTPLSTLQKYLPGVNISCFLISYHTTPDEISTFANKLSLLLGKTGVLVASVDFSHYQTLKVASENDLITQKYLENFNSGSLSSLGNSYLDSPTTIAVLFKYLSINSITHQQLVNHSNSAIILNQPDSPSTTSYFEYLYF
jgi:predicted class III extradiol MEMO1 family dioxygenase